MPAGRGYTEKVALMRTAERLMGHHLVPLGDLRVDGGAQVGKGVAKHSEDQLHPLASGWKSRQGVVVDDVPAEEFVYDTHVPATLGFFDKAADNRLVFCERHGRPPYK